MKISTLKILLVSFLFFFFGCFVNAQNPTKTAEEIIADIYEQLSEESESEIDFSSLYDDLIALSQNPIQLNSATKDDLEKLPFLSEMQIDNILYYLYRNNPMNSIYELQLIDGLDMTDIYDMLPFVTLGDAKSESNKLDFSNVFKYGKNELYLRIDRGLETKEGYRFDPENEENTSDETNKNYLGSAYYSHLKYRFNYKDRIKAGITMEKDAGEQFWGDENKGFDFYSAFVQMNNVGIFKTLVLGDYRANFGQGLVMKTDFSMGKSSYVTDISNHSNGFNRYSSTNEYDYLRGAAATIKRGKFDISAFYSNKMIDADTADGEFTSIKIDGLHRTFSELEKKNTVNEQVLGANIRYRFNWLQIGITSVYTFLNRAINPDTNNYNQFYFRGKTQWNTSIDYKFRLNRLNFYGETAIDKNNAIATINGMNFSPVSTVSLVTLYRYYSPKYNALFANAFGESSTVRNESGLYFGAEVHPIRYWKVSAYFDSYRFPWMKFGVDAPSYGKDYLLQIDYSPRRNLNMYWRVKYEKNEKNYTDTVSVMPVILPYQKTQGRYRLNYAFGNFSFQNQIDINSANNGVSPSTYGFSAFQGISYSLEKVPLEIDARLQIFDAQNYANRIYVYEQDVLYAFSIPMVYGKGSRYYLNLQYDITKKLSVWFKFTQTVYADERETISNGNEEITGNKKTDLRFLLRWKF